MDTLTAGHVFLHNPMPTGITVGDVWEKVGFVEPTARNDEPAFRVKYIFAQGSTEPGNRERTIIIDPGQSFRCNEVFGRDIAKTLEVQGIVLLEEGEELTPAKKLTGLAKAALNFHDRGGNQVQKFKQTHSLNDEQMKQEGYNLRFYLFNAERARLVEEEVKAVRSTPKSKKVAPPTEG